jgi:hypothetical protein
MTHPWFILTCPEHGDMQVTSGALRTVAVDDDGCSLWFDCLGHIGCMSVGISTARLLEAFNVPVVTA